MLRAGYTDVKGKPQQMATRDWTGAVRRRRRTPYSQFDPDQTEAAHNAVA
jgi:hypothetical protein